MTNRLELNWDLDGFVDEQRYYCSETPIDPLNLPTHKAILDGDVRTYSDTDIALGKTYYIRVGSVKNGIEKVSNEIERLAGNAWSPLNINPVFLLDDESSVTSQSGFVALWGSRSSNYFFGQSNQSNKPLVVDDSLNGKRAIRFDGVNDVLFNNTADLRGSLSNKQHAAVFGVFKHNNSSGGVLSAVTNNDGGSRFTVGVSSSTLDIYARRLDSNSESSRSIPSASGWIMFMQKIDFSTGRLETYINGVLVDFVDSFVTSGNVSTTLSDRPLSIGAYPNGVGDNPASGANLSIDIASYFLLDKLVLTSDIDKCFGYAAHKYGLADLLHASHPYKNLVPVL